MKNRMRLMATATCLVAGSTALSQAVTPVLAGSAAGAGGTLEGYVATDNGVSQIRVSTSDSAQVKEPENETYSAGASGQIEQYVDKNVEAQEGTSSSGGAGAQIIQYVGDAITAAQDGKQSGDTADTEEAEEENHDGEIMVGTVVGTSTLKIRSAADTDAKVLALLPEGEELELSGEENGFYKLASGDGYVSADYVKAYWVSEEQAFNDFGESSLSSQKAAEASDDSDSSKDESSSKKEESSKKDDDSKKDEDSSGKKDDDSDSDKKDKDDSEKDDSKKDDSKKDDSKKDDSKKDKSDDKDEDKEETSSKDEKEESSDDEDDEDESSSYSGSEVVAYALKYVGNPYKYGGSSLTKGADCSGFVMAVYKHFGVSLPHSSSSMRSVGKSVKVSNMKAGDIVCYSGHVGIYCGDGTIVHASNKKSGIKKGTDVNYRKIITVRRIF